jgi:glycosyltransferase involved in cell wall biosynthesis
MVDYEVVRRAGLRRLAGLVTAAHVIHLNTFSLSITILALLHRRPIIWQHIDYDTVCPLGICHRHGFPCTFSFQRCYRCLRDSGASAPTALRAIVAMHIRRVGSRIVRANVVNTSYAQTRMRLARLRYLPFGIEIDRWVGRPPTQRASDGLSVLFCGRHIPGKGCDVLIRALAVCRDQGLAVRARIAGEGPHLAVSQSLAKGLELDECVTFLGPISDDQLRQELHLTDVVAIPTLQDEIGQLVALEAMAAGAVVVVSDIGAFREQLGVAVELFSPGDYEALAGSLKKLLVEPKRRRQLAEDGSDLVHREFDVRVMAGRYETLYREVGPTSDS